VRELELCTICRGRLVDVRARDPAFREQTLEHARVLAGRKDVRADVLGLQRRIDDARRHGA